MHYRVYILYVIWKSVCHKNVSIQTFFVLYLLIYLFLLLKMTMVSFPLHVVVVMAVLFLLVAMVVFPLHLRFRSQTLVPSFFSFLFCSSMFSSWNVAIPSCAPIANLTSNSLSLRQRNLARPSSMFF